MANLTLRFKIEQHIVHETVLTPELRGEHNLHTVGDIKRHLARRLTIPEETICVYDTDGYLKLIEEQATPVKDLENDVPVPETNAVWYWSYLAEEPEEYRSKRDRCEMILDTAIEQVTIDMNMALFGIYRKVVTEDDLLSEQDWIRINLVEKDYKYRLSIGSTEEVKLRLYEQHCGHLVRIEERLKKRIEILGRDMGLAVGNIQSMFWNMKRMEENVELLDFNGPIGESDLQISVVTKRSAQVNVGLMAGIAPGNFRGTLDLPTTQITKNIAEEVSTDYPASPAPFLAPTPKTRSRRQSLVTNTTNTVDFRAESRAHLVTNVTSRSLDFTFTSNLFDIQKVSGIFVNLKKERAETLKMVHQLETRRQLWFLREYLFHLRTLIPVYEKYTATWTAVSSNYKLKRRRVTHISQGVHPVYEAGFIFASAAEYRTIEMSKKEEKKEVHQENKARITFSQEAQSLMAALKIELKGLHWQETFPAEYDSSLSRFFWWSTRSAPGFFFAKVSDVDPKDESVPSGYYGWYLTNGRNFVRESTFPETHLEVMKGVAEGLWVGWHSSNSIENKANAYVGDWSYSI